MVKANKHNRTTKPSVRPAEGFSRSRKFMFRASNDNRAPLTYLISKYALWLGPVIVIVAGVVIWLS